MGMSRTEKDSYRSSCVGVIIFGILGNLLVIISILRRKNMLKNNYYFFVLHLAICDLLALIIYLFDYICLHFLRAYILFYELVFIAVYCFQAAGVGMMLMISALRYRATVHP